MDYSIIVSLQELKSTYKKELILNVIPGFIQFTSFHLLTVALWCEKDIGLFHQMTKKHSLLVDATGTIASKLNEKEIFDFAFLSFNRSLDVEPVPHIELLTDRASFNTLEFVLSTLLEDEKRKYGYRSHSVPLLCTTDCSWTILKCLVSAFNKENLEAYIHRSYKVYTDEATVADLPSEPPKTFLHISLCHLMKSICYKINQSFKKEKQFVKFCISLSANAGNLKDVFDICESLFKILLSTTSSSCENKKYILNEKVQHIENILNKKAQHIENFKADSLSHKSSGFSDHVAVGDNNRTKLLPATEETYLQQSKRSIYFEKCRSIIQSVKICCLPNSTKNNDHVDTNNVLYSPSKRERLDDVVKNLYITKKSKLRQLEIAKCKTKTDVSQKEKTAKESLPSKIVSEKWSKHKRKQSGPGYFQKNKITKMSPKQLEDWEKLQIIPWGGDFTLPTGQKIHMCC